MLLGVRSAWVPIALLSGTRVLASCSDADESATPVPAKPGITQPKSGGVSLDEVEACRRLTEAEERRRRLLMCDELRHAPCPVYVRPAGTGCWTYSEDSVSACEAVIADYGSCLDFGERTCVLSALPADASRCSSGGGEGGGGPKGGGGEAGR